MDPKKYAVWAVIFPFTEVVSTPFTFVYVGPAVRLMMDNLRYPVLSLAHSAVAVNPTKQSSFVTNLPVVVPNTPLSSTEVQVKPSTLVDVAVVTLVVSVILARSRPALNKLLRGVGVSIPNP